MHVRDLIQFLEELSENNNRAWFVMNKPRYDILRAEFLELVTQLIKDIAKFDPEVAACNPKKALFRINREDGITVMCNLHDLDIAAKYCDRLIGMSAGKVVFDDVPQALTREIAAELYGIEAKDAGAEALDALDAIAVAEAKRARQKIA